MKYSPIKSGVAIAALGLAAFTLGPAVFRAHADQWNKKTILTVDQPIQITDTYLDPGTYVLKLADSQSDRHIVYIYNRDENHLINTVMAIPNYRLEPTGNSRFTFWETPPGTAKALRAWFYPGDNFGQEFRYPKNLRTIEVASLRVPAPAPPPPAVVEEVPPPAPVQPPPEPEAKIEQKEEVIIAQNNPPPPPAQVEVPPPAAAPAEPPKELPKTATPYPLAGLVGLISLGLYSLVKMKGSA